MTRSVTAYSPATRVKGGPGGLAALTPEIHKGLCRAIKRAPTFRTACHACGVSYNVVKDWLRRGAMPGADPKLAEFTLAFFKADSEHAAELYSSAEEDLRSEDPVRIAAAKLKLNECHNRWRDRDDLASILDGAGKKTDNLDALLQNPSLKLREAMARTGWMRVDTVIKGLSSPEHPVFRAMIEAGWRPPAIDAEGTET